MTKAVSLEFRHFGIFVVDITLMKKFYTEVLGYYTTDEGQFPDGQQLVFLSRDPAEHHQIILVGGRPDKGGFNLVNQISFYIEDLPALQSFYQLLIENEVDDLQAVTHGNAWSVYFRDPEGNRIEVYTDTPWYVSQPLRQKIDLSEDAESIYAQTESLCQNLPGFCSRTQWQASMRSLMNAGEKG
jgi:catechol-2,3-dioxygenase